MGKSLHPIIVLVVVVFIDAGHGIIFTFDVIAVDVAVVVEKIELYCNSYI